MLLIIGQSQAQQEWGLVTKRENCPPGLEASLCKVYDLNEVRYGDSHIHENSKVYQIASFAQNPYPQRG